MAELSKAEYIKFLFLNKNFDTACLSLTTSFSSKIPILFDHLHFWWREIYCF